MKKIKHIPSALLLTLLLFSACDDFLELPSTNVQAVAKFDDISRVFSGYLQTYENKGYPVRIAYTSADYYENALLTDDDMLMFESYSDNIDFENGLSNYLSELNYSVGEDRERFYADLFLYNDYKTPEKLWTKYYSIIGFLNGIEDRMQRFTDGDRVERSQLLGELFVHRAYHIFKLLQWFAPYDNNELGIPVYLSTGEEVVGISNPRKTQEEVYKIILDDLLKAENLYKEFHSSGYNQLFQEHFINNLLAQVYWFKAESAAKESEDYENARVYAERAILGLEIYIPTTTAELLKIWYDGLTDYPAFYMTGRENDGLGPIYGSAYTKYGYQPSYLPMKEDFVALFEDGDIRKGAYFQSDGKTLSVNIIDGRSIGGRKIKFHIFKPEEAYLIKAEAYYRLGNEAEALSVLNSFRALRGLNTLSGLAGEELLEELINERRREFFSRTDMRWIDLKRYGNKTINRNLTFFGKLFQITVEPNNYRYALPIPLDELRENPALKPNMGWTLIEY